MIAIGLFESGLEYVDEWGVFNEIGILIGIRDDSPDWVKERYHKDCEIMAEATKTMYKE